MPIAKTITESTTEAWVRGAPADQVGGERDQFQLVHQAAGRADEDGGQHEEPAGPRPYGKPRRAPRSDTCWSIMLRTLRHRPVAACHPQGCKWSGRGWPAPAAPLKRRRRDAHPHPGPGDHQLPFLRVRVPGTPPHLALDALGEHRGERVRGAGKGPRGRAGGRSRARAAPAPGRRTAPGSGSRRAPRSLSRSEPLRRDPRGRGVLLPGMQATVSEQTPRSSWRRTWWEAPSSLNWSSAPPSWRSRTARAGSGSPAQGPGQVGGAGIGIGRLEGGEHGSAPQTHMDTWTADVP
ncbi:hypothetical protein SMICM304S_05267 [Streptomyces microflavus]